MNATNKRPVQSKNEQPLMLGFFEKVFQTKNPKLIVNLTSPEGLRIYFTKVLELQQQGNDFPINLDDIWQLVYSEKSKAVNALKSSHLFLKDIDYQLLAQNGEMKREDGKGHRKADVYMLSTACMEYFIARKVRSVFEVYRQVFHQTLEEIQKLPSKRNHNRITPVRMVSILADVAKIEDSKLRLSLISKLGV